MANFKIINVFSLRDRGDVLIGEILNGEIYSRNIVYIVIDNNLIKSVIRGIEYIDHVESKLSRIGLIIDPIALTHKDQLIGQLINVLNE